MCFQSLVQNHCTADDQVRRLCARRVDSDPQYLHGELSLYVLLVIWFGCIQKQDSLLIRPYSPSCEPTLPDAFPSAFVNVRVATPYVLDRTTPALSSPEIWEKKKVYRILMIGTDLPRPRLSTHSSLSTSNIVRMWHVRDICIHQLTKRG